MQDYVLFGLDDAERVLAREALRAESPEAARRLAAEQLARFPRVEVWSNWVCVYRGRRPGPPADKA